MHNEDQYLRKSLEDPTMLAQSARRAARVGDGMSRLWWSILDAMQIGVLAMLALTPDLVTHWSSKAVLPMITTAIIAAILVACLRRAFRRNFFAKETMSSLLARSATAAILSFAAIAAFSVPFRANKLASLEQIIICGAAATLLSLLLSWSLARWSAATGAGMAAVAVIGDAAPASHVTTALKAGRWPGWTASVQLDGADANDIEQLRTAVASGEIDVVIIAVNGNGERVRTIVSALPDATARLCIAFDVPQQRAEESVIWLVDLWRNPHDGIAGAVKRMMDMVLSVMLLILLAPLLLLAALAVKLGSPGPVLFRQWRFGACSRPFQMVKFRTMRVTEGDPKGAQRTLANDPRVTTVGRMLRRTSIDELPQLWNVLVGDMSLVGPRAQALFMEIDGDLIFEALSDYPARHRVLPGITGWAQINGSRGEVDTLAKGARRVELDLWYIKNWSLQLDILILLRTAFGGFLNARAD